MTVIGNTKVVHTDPDRGDYYKLLDTGTYSLRFEAAGYVTQTISGVSTTWGTPTVLDVALVDETTDAPVLPALVALFADLGAAMDAIHAIHTAGHVPCAMEFMDARCLRTIGDLLPFPGAAAAGAAGSQ